MRRAQLALGAVVLALAAAASSRALAHRERAMWDEETKSTRLVTYALRPGDSLRVPIEPGTDVVRVVAHAFGHGALAEAGHRSLWRVGASEPLELVAPGAVGRARAEEQGVVVGDPVAFNVDASGRTSEVSLELESISEADGVLVRLYRRESLLQIDALRRRSSLTPAKRERLASRAGELDWVDLSADDRVTLVGARWQKLAPLPSDGRPFRPVIIDLAPAASEAEPAVLAEVGSASLGPGEIIGGAVTGPNRLVIRALDPAATISLQTMKAASGEQTLSGVGTLELGVAVDTTLEFRVATGAPTKLSLRATDSHRVQLSSELEYDRVEPEHPAIVQAAGSALVLRVDARPRSAEGDLKTGTARLVVDVTDGARTVTSYVDVTRLPPSADRHIERAVALVPPECTRFYVLLAARGRVTLRSAVGGVDLSLAELDPLSPTHRFVPRRPTNWAAFTLESHGTLRIARRTMQASEHALGPPPTIHASRPHVAGALSRDGRIFMPGSSLVRFDARAGQPGRLFLRLLSDQPAEVSILVDGAEPRRRVSSLATSITTGRTVHVEGETKLGLLIGDDLTLGTHVLSFKTTQGTLLVHAPWKKPRKPPPAMGWVAGDFEQ